MMVGTQYSNSIYMLRDCPPPSLLLFSPPAITDLFPILNELQWTLELPHIGNGSKHWLLQLLQYTLSRCWFYITRYCKNFVTFSFLNWQTKIQAIISKSRLKHVNLSSIMLWSWLEGLSDKYFLVILSGNL